MTSKIRFRGATSGFVEFAAPDAAGSNTLTLPTGNGTDGQRLQTDGNGTLSWETPTVYTQDALGTQHTLAGATYEWTGLPSTVRQITVSWEAASTDVANDMLIQLGTSSGYITTGYLSTSGNNTGSAYGSSTAGFIHDAIGTTQSVGGSAILTKMGDTAWAMIGIIKKGPAALNFQAGNLTGFTGTIDSVRITMVGNELDSGTASLFYIG